MLEHDGSSGEGSGDGDRLMHVYLVGRIISARHIRQFTRSLRADLHVANCGAREPRMPGEGQAHCAKDPNAIRVSFPR